MNTARTKADGTVEPKNDERKLKWDEENRLLAVDDNGFVSNYWYDADGERTVKTSGDGEAIYVNSLFSGGNTQTTKFTLYVSPYLVASQGGRYTKHIYIGSQRIVSKLGDLASYGADPRRVTYAGSETDNITVDYKKKYAAQQQVIKDNFSTFEVPYNGKDNNDYVDGKGFCCNDAPANAPQKAARANDNPELYQYYYHPDHLGSSSFITNLDGDVAQHIEYVPFGEVFIEERNNVWNTPYLFNAKELDEETGLYYYGARYYEPRISLWISVDPLQEKFPSISTYCYVFNNPIVLLDSDGNAPDKGPNVKNSIASTITSLAETAYSLYRKMEKIVEKNPQMLTYANYVTSSAAYAASKVTNTDPNTMSWGDLTSIWLFELGNFKDNTVRFGSNASTTKDLQKQEGVLRARQTAINNISTGNYSKDIDDTWVYGQSEFYQGVKEGNIVTSFLGSYHTNVSITKNKDGSFTLEFTVTNTTGWESGTRLRKDNNKDGQHDAIIPDKERGKGIKLGGNIVLS